MIVDQNQVHRRGAEIAEGFSLCDPIARSDWITTLCLRQSNQESFNGCLSAEEARSHTERAFYLAVSYRQIKQSPSLRSRRLCGENPILDKSDPLCESQ